MRTELNESDTQWMKRSFDVNYFEYADGLYKSNFLVGNTTLF